MSEDKPEIQENQEKEDDTDTNSNSANLESHQKTSRTWVNKRIDELIRFSPLGGSGFFLISSFLRQEWVSVIISFPVTLVSVIWASYSESVLTRFSEIYAERGKQDVDSLMKWLEKVDKTIKETIKWQLAGVEDKYLKLQGNTCKDFTTEGYKPSNIFVPLLNEVFVPLDLSNNFYRNLQGESLPLPQGLKWDKSTLELIDKEGLKIWDVLKQANKYPAFKRLAVIAWGGFGKTTLLRHITYIYIKKKEKRYQAPKLLPVLIFFRKWQKTIATENDLDLPTLIEIYHIPNLPESEGFNLPPNWARNHLKNGKLLVMFDGFDEVKEDWRIQVSEWLGKQMNNYQDTIFILTSRPSGYKHFITEYKLKAELFVKPFNQAQQERFINNWYWCQERYARGGRDTGDVKEEAKNNANNLLQQLKERPELDDLAKNPLLLNMITTLHRSYPREELPRRRSDLYREVVSLQLGNRPLAKRIKLLLPADEAQQVLQKLALYMVQENKPAVNYNLLFSLVEYSGKSFDNSLDIKEFIKQIIDVSELLVKRDENYEFAHLSFQGYLASKEIIETKQEDLLINHWQESWWRETILLFSAQVNPNNLLRQLIDIRSDEALKLAKLCIKETPRKVDDDVTKYLTKSEREEAEKEFQNIESQVDNLLFQKLEEYLKNGQWKEADEETNRLMLQLGDKDEKGYLNTDDCRNFPREELRTIDRLWLDNSEGKFGFSVQKRIYLEEGGKLDDYDYDSYQRMSDRIGWYKNKEWLSYSELIFDNTTAPQGHLPVLLVWKVEEGSGARWCTQGWEGVSGLSFFSSLESNT